jgi:hypothetical protein
VLIAERRFDTCTECCVHAWQSLDDQRSEATLDYLLPASTAR